MFRKYLMGALAVSLFVVTLSITAYAGSWVKGQGADKGRWWYQYEDGSYPRSCTLTIDGTEYTFDKDGWWVDTAADSTATAASGQSSQGPSSSVASAGSEKGLVLVAEASKYIGAGVVPYVSGGRSLKGTDCSGFLHIIYGLYGVDLPYTPTDVYAKCRKISQSELQPGDFIFFTKNGGASISHVAIYAGDGYMVHQTNRARNGVFKDLISNMYLDGVTSYYGAGTVLR